MLKVIREQLERLAETSPQIPDPIIVLFNKNFHDQKNVSKPEITNGLDPIQVYVEHEAGSMSPVSKVNVKVLDSLGVEIPVKPPMDAPPTPLPKISIPGRTPGR
jgi:hypothetical protein